MHWLQLDKKDSKNEDNIETIAVSTSVGVAIAALAAAVALTLVVKQRIKAREERFRRMNEIRKFSYLPTESNI